MNPDQIKELLQAFSSSQADSLLFQEGQTKLELRKHPSAPIVHTVQASAANGAPQPPQQPQTAATETTAIPPAKADDPSLHTITSPIVGTFYRSPGPGQKEFVKVGDKVNKGQTLCIVEAMKVMNPIESEVAGEVAEILMENGAPVEFGTGLIKVRC